jgi:cellulose synthase/poly-beta-1,6-N-acetylglucosamine synthase-like glycosyltransferase
VDIFQILFGVLSGFFLLSFSILVIYYFVVFGKLAFYKNQEQKEYTPPVSVVICARNEAQNLFNHLQKRCLINHRFCHIPSCLDSSFS